MHRSALNQGREGFTLLELLVAGAVGVVVIGLAIKAFGEISKVMGVSRSKVEAQRQAATGLDAVSEQFKRAHVFFYAARPLTTQPGEVTGRPGEHAPRLALPASLQNLGATGNTVRPPADRNLQVSEAAWRAAAAMT